MSQLFSPNAGMNGPLGASMPDRFRTLGTGLADATVGAIVSDRKANQSIQWGLMAPGCDGLPNLNTLNDVTCCADNCPDTGTWVLINRQHGIPTLASAAQSRPFASTSGPPVVFAAPLYDPCIMDVRISLLDTEGNKWRIVDEVVAGVKMAAGSLRSTGETPAAARPAADPNRYVSAFYWFTTDGGDIATDPNGNKSWLQFPSLTGANADPTWDGSSTISASGILTAIHPALGALPSYDSYYAGLPVQNHGFFGECGRNVFTFGLYWPLTYGYSWYSTQGTGIPMVLGTGAYTGCGRVQSDGYLFGIEAPLPNGDNAAATVPDLDSSGGGRHVIPAGNVGVMVRDALGVGDALLQPITWTPLPALYPGGSVVRSQNVPAQTPVPLATQFSICACEDGSVFVNPVGTKTVWQFRYDAATRKLVLIRTVTLAATGGAAWTANTILTAVLEAF